MSIIGTVNIRDWDKGCYLTLGCEVVTYVKDGRQRGQYVISVPGVSSGLSEYGNKIPVFMAAPEDAFQNYVLPCIVIKQNDMSPAFDRQPWFTWAARAPAPGAKKITLEDGRVGYSRYVNQWRGTPYDISYDVTIMARRRQVANMMLLYVQRRTMPPSFIFKLIDSLGDVREYDAVDVSTSATTDLVDISERTAGWTVSFTVRGEIDLHDDREFAASTDIVTDILQKE